MTAAETLGCATVTNDWDRLDGIYREVAIASADVHTLSALATSIEQAAHHANLQVRVHSERSHADLLQRTDRVGVFVLATRELASSGVAD